ncbi:hypothetical protein ALQ33_200147 [Pseudomonas syringae pv. philadelphi]|uniref:Uncharacterized protein n=1 Tax=Pseudomonas syringae pv. philadelphi TaxID=251706 RepID=A0A3M3YBL0_9PSED|nr:hypothetical protein [Pseudomonas syringae group genomosp. 3]RMO79800.1 hypothetical protein ALQ33_200147 [Pseudomonas syringae pv. philadelphi]
MANRQSYTVLVGYPKGGGHYTAAGEVVDLLDVQANALEAAGRVALTSALKASAATAAAETQIKAPKAAVRSAE